MSAAPYHLPTTLSFEQALNSFQLALRAEGKSPHTVDSYSTSVEQLAAFLRQQGFVGGPREVGRDDVNAFTADLREKRTPASVATRFDALKRFFGWLEGEEEIDASPMAKMHRPTVPNDEVPLISVQVARQLIATCRGRTFGDRRDEAIIRVLWDTGVRVASSG
jgi:site-specific recombinase XerD